MKKHLAIALILVALLLSGCGFWDNYPHTLKVGDIVIMKLDGQRGQVVRLNAHHDGIWVRLPSILGGYKDQWFREGDVVFISR
jgi:outer membrane lipopolysaccharide assembly protein LptE/RlpB